MALRTELVIRYDDDMLPVSGACTHCGEEMPWPAAGSKLPADIVLWFSIRFLEHKRLNHPTSFKRDDEEIAPEIELAPQKLTPESPPIRKHPNSGE